MNYKYLQRIRSLILYTWLIILPISFNWLSPVLIIMAGFQTTINLSFIIFGAWFVSSLFLGRLYCAWGCQWGAMQEIFGNSYQKPLDRKKKVKNRKIKYPFFVIWVIFIFLGPIIAGGYIKGVDIFFPNPKSEQSVISFDKTEPGQLIFYFGIQILIAVFFTALAGKRSFCNYGCPMAVIGVIGKKIGRVLHLPQLGLKSDSEKCIKCKKCEKACPMGLNVQIMVEQNDMKNIDCINCGSCCSACPKDVLTLAFCRK